MLNISIPRSKKFWIIFSVIVVLLLAGGGTWWYMHNKKVVQQKAEEQKNVEVALKNIFALAGLPIDEDPASSEVKNLESVKDSPFFKDAKEGDLILFFRKARIAAVMRPSEGKIISKAQVVGEIPAEFKNLGGNAEVTEPINIGILNGSTTSGLADKAAEGLAQAFKSDINVSYKDNARKTDYQVTTVVDLGGQNPGLAKSLAAYLKGTVGDFPPGEKLPPAMDKFPEILIFVTDKTQ